MELTTVKIRNFRGYGVNPRDDEGHFTFEDLDTGLVVLNGFNGFGKTSFYDAIEWCLTDSISRLDFKERGLYDATTLKHSEYLKFVSPKDTKRERENRVAQVYLEFSNGIKILRTTNSNYLSVTEKDSYQSTLELFDGEKWHSDVNTSEHRHNGRPSSSEIQLAKIFLSHYDPSWQQQLMGAHFLGQENMNNFLRTLKPQDRRGILMRLLNLNSLENLFEKSGEIKSSTAITQRMSRLRDSIQKKEDKSREIQDLFMNRNWGTIDSYLETLKNAVSQLMVVSKRLQLQERLMLGDVVADEGINLHNYSSIIGALATKRSYLHSILEKTKSELAERRLSAENIKKLKFLENRLELNKRQQRIQYLLNTDINALRAQSGSYPVRLEELRIEENACISLQRGLSEYDSLSNIIPSKYIDKELNRIYDSFWDFAQDASIKISGFIEKYHHLISNQDLTWTNPINFPEFKTGYLEASDRRVGLGVEIKALRDSWERMSVINREYQDTLEYVRRYLINHSNDIVECPVCLNSDFSSSRYSNIGLHNESPVSEKLLLIVQGTLSAGDERLSSVYSQLADLESQEAELTGEIVEKFVKVLYSWVDQFASSIFNLLKTVQTVLSESLSRVREEIQACTTQATEINVRITSYQALVQEVLGGTVDGGVDVSQLAAEADHVHTQIREWEEEALTSNVIKAFPPLLDDVEDMITTLKAQKLIKDFYPDGLERLNEHLKLSEVYIRDLETVDEYYSKIMELNPSQNEIDLINNYLKLAENTDSHHLELQRLTELRQNAITINQIVTNTQHTIIDEQLRNNKLVNWIFKMVYPHPFYKELRLDGDRKGINVTNVDGDVILDHIFSSAQLNILALSIFLGLGLTQRFSKWNHLFLDDPIQSMDDIKVLSFIDVLRSILDSQMCDRKLVLSTHDDNFAKLLAIKFRNKPYTQYNFTGYGPQGPVFNKVNTQ